VPTFVQHHCEHAQWRACHQARNDQCQRQSENPALELPERIVSERIVSERIVSERIVSERVVSDW
jgi:hypothetical protein